MIAFRVDSSSQLGNGHVMRCLTLAQALAGRGERCIFICANLDGGRHLWLEAQGFPVLLINASDTHDEISDAEASAAKIVALDEKISWLVVDVYRLSARWHRQLRPLTERILVIDDLCNRDYDCDLLLDQNFGSQAQAYQARGVALEQCCVGSQFALLRPEFATLRRNIREIRRERNKKQQLNRLLISMGGTDFHNFSLRLLQSLETFIAQSDALVTVVVAANAPHLQALRAYISQQKNIELTVDAANMGQLMHKHDIAIGASGASTWERCCLGLPTITFVTAENQKLVATKLAEAGAICTWHGATEDITALRDYLNRQIQRLSTDTLYYQQVVDSALAICDGTGVIRILKKMGIGVAK